MIKQFKLSKKMIAVISGIIVLLGIYTGMSVYFTNHFFFGTKLNNSDIAGKTVEQVNDAMTEKTKTYSLNVQERNGASESISASDIGLKDNSEEIVSNLKNSQKAFNWLLGSIFKKDTVAEQTVDYDQTLLDKAIKNLKCLQGNNVVQPQNPTIDYNNGQYVINKEVVGNKLDKDGVKDNITNAVKVLNTNIDLEAANCYQNPSYTSTSQEVTAAKDALTKYISSKITYSIGNSVEVVGPDVIKGFTTVSSDYQVSLDKDKVYEYVLSLAKKYNTYGKTRTFTTSLQTQVSVSGGDYGWIVDKNSETEALMSDIENGQVTTKDLTYTQTATSHDANDIGNTYVEINLTTQHLWFYKNGSLVTQGDVVTGNVANNTATPTGVYYIKTKEKNATLKGEDYTTPVNYWMPFNGGIGIHDALWRDKFGGTIYQTTGSHGCINSPMELVTAIYNSIDTGTPVIVYNN